MIYNDSVCALPKIKISPPYAICAGVMEGNDGPEGVTCMDGARTLRAALLQRMVGSGYMF